MRTIPGFDTKLAVHDFDNRAHSRKSVPLTVKTLSLRGFSETEILEDQVQLTAHGCRT